MRDSALLDCRKLAACAPFLPLSLYCNDFSSPQPASSPPERVKTQSERTVDASSPDVLSSSSTSPWALMPVSHKFPVVVLLGRREIEHLMPRAVSWRCRPSWVESRRDHQIRDLAGY